jgi:hypothetical protein
MLYLRKDELMPNNVVTSDTATPKKTDQGVGSKNPPLNKPKQTPKPKKGK